ncbi:hypothetical protein JIG36_36325 [Actinoplanes sp. LDG1-06]|uniref:Uncharacterized protein n=1 Tax=Paractinoplanes ovalisporus TaxID=2810368 RepID=A0ABS2AMC0_9ACTN|nr:hypothetical protein [Actinoplanes ovalisporus]MBM2620981.1 hypothetical protein [Actinoplanes ovalisporus]
MHDHSPAAADGSYVHEEHEVFRYVPFPFPEGQFPHSLGAVVQRTVLEGVEPARQVFHTADNSWNVGDGVNDPNEPGAVVVTCLRRLVDRDPSMAQLVDLPHGYEAYRAGPDQPWRREPFTPLD